MSFSDWPESREKVNTTMDENKLCLRVFLKSGHAFVISALGVIQCFTSMNNLPNAWSERAD